jgi:hypothetical protein
MKAFLSVLVVFVYVFAYGQSKQPRIEQIFIKDRIMHGTIDDKYGITLYLRFSQYSENNFLIYSVEGWYYYDHLKKKIPLVGIHSGTLCLYQFDNKEQADTILNMISTKEDPWEQLDELTSKSAYKEKFELDFIDGLVQGTWKTPKKSLKVQFYESQFSVDALDEYLRVSLNEQDEAVYNLSQIGPVSRNYEISAAKKVGKHWRVLLYYAVMSSGNPNGLCGAGQEIGYVLLVVDEQGKIIEFTEVVVESCHRNIYFEEASSSTKEVLDLRVIQGDEPEIKVTIDKNLVQLVIIKSK